MNCYIVQDLLPNYIDGLNSGETNANIESHLAQCEACKAVYEKMAAQNAVGIEAKKEVDGIDFLKKLKSTMLRRNAIIAIVAGAAVIIGIVIVLMNRHVPMPFDGWRMGVGIARTAVRAIHDEQGNVIAHNLRRLTTDDPDPDEYVRHEVELVFNDHPRAHSFIIAGRNIYRDGENMRLVFYCYTQPLFLRLFPDRIGNDGFMRIWSVDIQGDHYDPQLFEVYYLSDLSSLKRRYGWRLAQLSDEGFDALRENAVLVWRGINGEE